MILAIEKVQRRATKNWYPALKNQSYPERIRKLGLPSLEYRRELKSRLNRSIQNNAQHR